MSPPRRRLHQRNLPNAKPSGRNTVTLFAIPWFAVVFVAVSIFWAPPFWVAPFYLGASVVTFVVYALDKAAAERGAWRTSEKTLHLLALVGGWPGALLAQQFLRHKSAKPSFRLVFWMTVILNLALYLLFCSPLLATVVA